MINKELEVGFNPPVEEEKDDEKVEMILDLIKEKGCSYPAEIMGVLNISSDTVYRKCRFLEEKGLLERMSLDGKRWIPEWLQPRIKELWARGIKGEKIRRMSWYRVVGTDGIPKKDPAKLK